MTVAGVGAAIVFVLAVLVTTRLWTRYIERWARRRRKAGSTSIWLRPSPSFTDTPKRRVLRYGLIAAVLILIVLSRAAHGTAGVLCLIAAYMALAVVLFTRWYWSKRPMSLPDSHTGPAER